MTEKPTPSRGGHTIAIPGQMPKGEPIFGVLVKRTYDITPGRKCQRAADDHPLLANDVFYDDPVNSTVRYESDLVAFKLATDVVLNGVAYAPQMKPTAEFTASLLVGEVRKDIRVLGERVVRFREGASPTFTDPKPITSVELRYEQAYGGVDIYSQPKAPCPYPRNPLGRGYAVSVNPRAIEGLELPNLEDPANPLSPDRLVAAGCVGWDKQPAPAGFGWIPKHWQPRAGFAGLPLTSTESNETLRKVYAPYIPPVKLPVFEQSRLPQIDYRFYNGGTPGLVLPYLKGDETIRTTNLTPMGELAFRLPGDVPKLAVDLGSGVQTPPLVLHTVQIRLEDWQVDLVWRGAVPYPGLDWLPEMAKLEIMVE